jgi:hypothetical protein
MSVVRPLPARPSLEFDRKEAKALHRQLRAGDPEALARARAQHPSLTATPADIKLADAQHVIAREYGFSSWPRMVQYYAGVARQMHSVSRPSFPEHYERRAASLAKQHAARSPLAGRLLAAYVPRFYGMSVDEVFAHSFSEYEARLAIARSNGAPSWEVLLERAAEHAQPPENHWEGNPMSLAWRAIEQADLPALKALVEKHPELLHPAEAFEAEGGTLLNAVLTAERTKGREALSAIVEWLVSQGQDMQRELNMQLRHRGWAKVEDIRFLLDRGADPHWIDANGVSALELALLRFWNGEASELIAQRVRPRDALWMAAGLGDVQGIARFLDRDGKPTAAARKDRPPFEALGRMGLPSLPDPDDEEILLEAFWVAVLNGRTNVIEYMASRGFNIDSQKWGAPVVNIAVGNNWAPVVESLVKCGANLDLRGWDSNGTARQMARELWENGSHGPSYRRVVELCGLDPDAILAERDATPLPIPVIAARMARDLEAAAVDARVMGQHDVRPENLLFGMLRGGGLPLLYFTQQSDMDHDRFYADVKSRVDAVVTGDTEAPLPMHEDAQQLIDAAVALASRRRTETVNALHLLSVLLNDEQGVAARLLAKFGGSAARLREALERAI